MASTLGELLQSLRTDAEGKSAGELSPALKAAMENYTRSYAVTMTALQKSYEKGLSGLEKKLAKMAAVYEQSSKINTDDTRALIKELLTSQNKANVQQSELNAQWRELAESYFPQISKEQLDNEIAKRREQEKRMELLKQELGISRQKVNTVKTEMQLLDSFKSFGKDPLINSLVDLVKGKLQGGIDERTAVFEELSKKREGDIATFQKTAMGAYSDLTKKTALPDKEATKDLKDTEAVAEKTKAEKPTAEKSPFHGIEEQLKSIASSLSSMVSESPVAEPAQKPEAGEPPIAESATSETSEPPVAGPVTPETSEPPVAGPATAEPVQEVSTEPPVAKSPMDSPLAQKATDAVADKAMDKITPAKAEAPVKAASGASTGALGGKGGFLNLGGMGKGLSSVISKGLSGLGGVLLKALGPIGWIVTIAKALDSIVPIFSSTFGALYDLAKMLLPFLASLAVDSITALVTSINGTMFALDELVHALPGMGDSMRQKAEKSGAMKAATDKAQEDKQRKDEAVMAAKRGFVPFVPASDERGVSINPAEAPTLIRDESPLTTPSEERAIRETAPTPIPIPPQQDQSALIDALQRITAPQNPGTTAIFPINPYLQPFSV